ncbi:MAG TPA: hypothetical protein VK435_11965 [Thermodesulfovibrionales bacterium]|nr:hypothetical protein [Thermodesulfovibrionales bacterium]
MSCAAVPSKEDSGAALRAAADNYWKLRLQGSYEGSYRLEDKEGLPAFEEYRGKASAIMKIKIISISVKSVNVSDDRGAVELEYSYQLPKVSQPFHQVLPDYWVYSNGTWLHVFK